MIYRNVEILVGGELVPVASLAFDEAAPVSNGPPAMLPIEASCDVEIVAGGFELLLRLCDDAVRAARVAFTRWDPLRGQRGRVRGFNRSRSLAARRQRTMVVFDELRRRTGGGG